MKEIDVSGVFLSPFLGASLLAFGILWLLRPLPMPLQEKATCSPPRWQESLLRFVVHPGRDRNGFMRVPEGRSPGDENPSSTFDPSKHRGS